MDTVRLSIIYETGQAAAKLNDVEKRLNKANAASVAADRGAHTLKRGLEGLAFSAAGVPGPIGKISTSLLAMSGGSSVILGVVAAMASIVAAYKLAVAETENLAKANKDLVATYEQILSQAGPNVAAVLAMRKANEALDQALEAQDLARQSREFHPFRFKGPVLPATDAELLAAQRNVDQAKLNVAAATQAFHASGAALVDAATKAATHVHRLAVNLHELTKSGKDAADKFASFFNQHELTKSTTGTTDKLMSMNFHDLTKETKDLQTKMDEATRGVGRDAILIRDAIDIASGTLGDFVVNGTLAFTDFLDNILRLLVRSFTSDLASTVVGALTGGGGGKFEGSTEGLRNIPELQPVRMGGVTTNVNFSVQAMDAQGVSQFLERHGGNIAATVTAQADRSRAIRRRYWRG